MTEHTFVLKVQRCGVRLQERAQIGVSREKLTTWEGRIGLAVIRARVAIFKPLIAPNCLLRSIFIDA